MSCLTVWDIRVFRPSPAAEHAAEGVRAMVRGVPAELVSGDGYTAGGLVGGSLVVGDADGVVFGWVWGSEDHDHRKHG